MGCGSSTETPDDAHKHGNGNYEKQKRDPTPQPRDPTPPPPRESTPPPRDPTPQQREPTPPPPREPTPPARDLTPPPREPTPLTRDPTPLPTHEPTPPPRDPTPPKREPTPPPRNPTGGTDGYVENANGIKESSHEFRSNQEPSDKEFTQQPTDLPFVDTEFPANVAIKNEPVEWKRPGEIRDCPVLFSEGTTRYDVGQGSAGTCWFLSILAMVAERPELFHRVFSKDAWDNEGGYFHCRFWRFGEWEDVYIDDFLPVTDADQLWGAKSEEDPNEMWPALLEKAFARFHGGYQAVYGGAPGDAFLALTGGCSEFIDFEEDLGADPTGTKMKKALALHARVKNACRTGSMLTTEVPKKYDNQRGLVGDHAYSLTGAITTTDNSGKEEHLVRIRNPWGNTEWDGPWSDGSSEWSTVDASSIPHAKKDDGEFWMCLKDFVKYFSGLTICSMKPDFDQDGCDDSMDYCTSLFGDWSGETAAGFENLVNGPRYHFNIGPAGADESGLCPLVTQICQKLKHRLKNIFSIRVDIFKIKEVRETGNGPEVDVTLLGHEDCQYKEDLQMSERIKVEPGSYLVIPSTSEAGQEKEFLVRVFSSGPITDIRELGRKYTVIDLGNEEDVQEEEEEEEEGEEGEVEEN